MAKKVVTHPSLKNNNAFRIGIILLILLIVYAIASTLINNQETGNGKENNDYQETISESPQEEETPSNNYPMLVNLGELGGSCKIQELSISNYKSMIDDEEVSEYKAEFYYNGVCSESGTCNPGLKCDYASCRCK